MAFIISDHAVDQYRDRWVPELPYPQALAHLLASVHRARPTGVSAGRTRTVWLDDAGVRYVIGRDAATINLVVVTVLPKIPDAADDAQAIVAADIAPPRQVSKLALAAAKKVGVQKPEPVHVDAPPIVFPERPDTGYPLSDADDHCDMLRAMLTEAMADVAVAPKGARGHLIVRQARIKTVLAKAKIHQRRVHDRDNDESQKIRTRAYRVIARLASPDDAEAQEVLRMIERKDAAS